jgi:hypothetical protein
VVARSLPRRLFLGAFLPGVIGTRPQSGAKNFAHLKLIKLSTYKTFATKLIGITRLV